MDCMCIMTLNQKIIFFLFGAMCWKCSSYLCGLSTLFILIFAMMTIMTYQKLNVYMMKFISSLWWPYTFWKVCWFFRRCRLFVRPLASRENKCAKELMFLVDELFISNEIFLLYGNKEFKLKSWRMKNFSSAFLKATVQIDQ